MNETLTPQEKALELIEKFKLNDNWGEICTGQAIDSALVCVKTIIGSIPMYIGNLNPQWSYWTEVLKYLENN